MRYAVSLASCTRGVSASGSITPRQALGSTTDRIRPTNRCGRVKRCGLNSWTGGAHAPAADADGKHGDLQQQGLVGDLVRRELGHAPHLRARAESVAWFSTEHSGIDCRMSQAGRTPVPRRRFPICLIGLMGRVADLELPFFNTDRRCRACFPPLSAMVFFILPCFDN